MVPSNRDAVRELKALGLWSDRKAAPMQAARRLTSPRSNCGKFPSSSRDAVNAEFQKVLAPRPDEMDDAEVRRFLREDFPGIVDAAMVAHIRNEVGLSDAPGSQEESIEFPTRRTAWACYVPFTKTPRQCTQR